MPGFFDALQNLPEPKAKKFFLNVEGKEYEVPLEKYIWGRDLGMENLMIKDGEIVRKPRRSVTAKYPVLQQADKGYFFEDNDIHWPSKIADGGVTWQIKSE